MEPNEQNKKKMDSLGMTWEVKMFILRILIIRNRDKFACFTGENYQGELSSFLLGWEMALGGTSKKERPEELEVHRKEIGNNEITFSDFVKSSGG